MDSSGTRFYHLTGLNVWSHCDHYQTAMDIDTETVRLSFEEPVIDTAGQDPNLLDEWLKVRGGALFHYFAEDQCVAGTGLLVTRSGEAYAIDEKGAWASFAESIENYQEESCSEQIDPYSIFNDQRYRLGKVRALMRDVCGDYWILGNLAINEGGSWGAETDGLHHVEAKKLVLRMTIPLPLGANIVDIAATNWGFVAIDSGNSLIWRLKYGGDWEVLSYQGSAVDQYHPVAVAGGPIDYGLVLLRPNNENNQNHYFLKVLEKEQTPVSIPNARNPLPLIILPDESVLLGELTDVPGNQKPTLFNRFKWTDQKLDQDELVLDETWTAWAFDGRGLYIDDSGQAMATTSNGVRPVVCRIKSFSSEGVLETYALDSRIHSCQWHRLFIDICLPNKTGIEVFAKTSDELLNETMLRSASEPDNYGGTIKEWEHLPLGSSAREDNIDWLPLGTLDRKPSHDDIPFSPIHNSAEKKGLIDGRKAIIHESLPQQIRFSTLEGLLKNKPGRYLWLRVRFSGTRKASPLLKAVRATYQRPSLLAYLPAYWRADESRSKEIDHVLSLFEGELTELQNRIAAMPILINPEACPGEALDWLASFLALTFDYRVAEKIKRRLLDQVFALYKQRGTQAGLKSLLEVLTEADVQIIEGFRMRGFSAAFLGQGDPVNLETAPVLGQQFHLGAYETKPQAGQNWEEWERDLIDRYEIKKQIHDAGMLIFENSSDLDDMPCPPELPEEPIITNDAVISYYRRYAHRFSVLVFKEKDSDLSDLVEETIETWKPAHTIHRTCWLEEGFRLGANTYVEIGTRIGQPARMAETVLSEAALGSNSFLS